MFLFNQIILVFFFFLTYADCLRKDIWDLKKRRSSSSSLGPSEDGKWEFHISPFLRPTQPSKMQNEALIYTHFRQSFFQCKTEHPILNLSVNNCRDHYFLTIDYIYSVLCMFVLVKSWIFKYSFLWGHFPPPLVPYGLRKSGGLVLTSRAQQSTALFCSEPALLPKAEINQSWLRLSRNKSRPVQSWSLPSQNVILWLSLRIN